MSDFSDTNTGILFTNDKKGNEKAPDYSGRIFFGDEEKQLAGWIREGKKGKFLSLKVSDKYNSGQSQGYSQQSGSNNTDEPPF